MLRCGSSVPTDAGGWLLRCGWPPEDKVRDGRAGVGRSADEAVGGDDRVVRGTGAEDRGVTEVHKDDAEEGERVMEYWLMELWPEVEWERLKRYYGLECSY